VLIKQIQQPSKRYVGLAVESWKNKTAPSSKVVTTKIYWVLAF
jgi:hypothetical protein